MATASYDHLESFEELHQDKRTRELVLRLARLARGGQLDSFMDVLGADRELDDETKHTVLALAREREFLLAFEDYSRSCLRYH